MIVALTDGVGLTNHLGAQNSTQAARQTTLSNFFRAQIEAFENAATDQTWRVIKTTGDGLFLSIDDHESADKDALFHRALLFLNCARLRCETFGIQLRSVFHHCPDNKIIYGKDLDFGVKFDAVTKIKIELGALNADVFGLEIIRLARIAAVVKGPFHLLTHDFVRAMTGRDTNIVGMKQKLEQINQEHKDIYFIHSDPIRLPLLKGFFAKGEDFDVSFWNPYLVWEIDYRNQTP